MLGGLFRRAGSLRSVLALYFIPISVLPLLILSLYATQLFERSSTENLGRTARQERDVVLSEISRLEEKQIKEAKKHASFASIRLALKTGMESPLREVERRVERALAIYTLQGERMGGGTGLSQTQVKAIALRGHTIQRVVSNDPPKGIQTIVRVPILNLQGGPIGFLEERVPFAQSQLAYLRNRRQVDAVILDARGEIQAWSFALTPQALQGLNQKTQKKLWAQQAPQKVTLGGERYAGFFYDLPGPNARPWGYLGVFVSMTEIDAILSKLRIALISLTTGLVVLILVLIFLFSNRLVKPIVLLVSAMRELKAGKVEEIERDASLDSTEELHYLVQSFNEMAHNIVDTKKELEKKLSEIQSAHTQIKETQNQLVQSAKMASLGQLVAGVAHELNNPIGFIHSNIAQLSEYHTKMRTLIHNYQRLHQALPEDQRKQMEKMHEVLEVDYILKDVENLTQSCLEGTDRTKEIVLGLRNFSRTEGGGAFLACDIHEGIENTLKIVRSQFGPGIVVHKEFGDLPEIEANLSQLNQVFLNLFTNAAQAMKGKGELWIRTSTTASGIQIEVEDNGCGMPKSVLDHIFDPFYTTKKVGEGTGLGLSIAYGILQRHGGTIDVTSKEGVGTRFTLQLPIQHGTTVSNLLV